MSETKLKCCPFCGDDAKTKLSVIRGVSQDCLRFSVFCPRCKVERYTDRTSGCNYQGVGEAINETIKSWNRRVAGS